MDKIIEQNVTLAKAKNQEAMSFLYEHFYKDVYYTCYKFLNNEELAKDMTHDAFIKAFEKIDDLSDGTKFKSWICQIASRICLNYIKRSNIIVFEEIPEAEEMMDTACDSDRTPEDITVDNEVANILLKAIEKLPYDQRICVFMFYYENMSVKEIASQIECSENTVRGKLRYASINLQKYIENLGDEVLKLRCICILPFLYSIFNIERASVTASPAPNALASITQTSGNISATNVTAAPGVATTASNVATSGATAVSVSNVAGAVATTASVAAKTSILPFILIGTGVVATVAAVITAIVIGVNGKDKNTEDTSDTNKVTISQETASTEENTTEITTEKVDTDENTYELNHYDTGKVFEPILWGKYLFYYDLAEEKSIIRDVETGKNVKEVDAKTTEYRDCGDAVIILWSNGEYKELCILDKQGQYFHEDTMYVGDASNDYANWVREFCIDDLLLTKDSNYVYLAYNDDTYSLKSFNLSDGKLNYETTVAKGIIASKNQYYAVYSNKEADEVSIVNIETGSPIATYPKSQVGLLQIRLLEEYYAISQYENMYLTNYTRFNINGEIDVNIKFSVDDKISPLLYTGIEQAHGSNYIFLEREKNGLKEKGVYRSDMTPIIEFSSDYADYSPYSSVDYAGEYADVYPIFDYSYIGKILTNGGTNTIEASQMVDIISDEDFIEALNNDATKKIINMNNGSIFEVSSSANVYKIGHRSANEYSFAVIDGDKTDIYDKHGNYVFTTSVPIYDSLKDTQSIWYMNDGNLYVYNHEDETDSNIYVYDKSKDTEIKLTAEKPVIYSFAADDKNIIYSTSKKAGQYEYRLINIETNEETVLFESDYGVLYNCNEYGFVIGEKNSDISYITNIECDVVTYE